MSATHPTDPSPIVPPTHLDLLEIARTMRLAVMADDAERMHVELARLRTALVHHINAEQDEVDGFPGVTPEVARDGQRRLLELLEELLLATDHVQPEGHGDPEWCHCLARAAEIDLALRRQAKLEAALRRARRIR